MTALSKAAGPVKVRADKKVTADRLRRVLMKLTVKLQHPQEMLFIRGVVRVSKEPLPGPGGFADIWKGKWQGRDVALKRLFAGGTDQDFQRNTESWQVRVVPLLICEMASQQAT